MRPPLHPQLPMPKDQQNATVVLFSSYKFQGVITAVPIKPNKRSHHNPGEKETGYLEKQRLIYFSLQVTLCLFSIKTPLLDFFSFPDHTNHIVCTARFTLALSQDTSVNQNIVQSRLPQSP